MKIEEALMRAGEELQKRTAEPLRRQELIERAVQLCGADQGSVCPADYCYNRENKMHDTRSTKRIFLFVSDGEYFYVGDSLNWVGKVERKPRT